MKKYFKTLRVFVSMLAIGCTTCLVSCSDDDEVQQPQPDEISTKIVYGAYNGKMFTSTEDASEAASGRTGEETPEGVEMEAVINNDTICFEDFPIKDIVMSIVNDEAMADQIVEAVGKVSYRIGYTPSVADDDSHILLAMDPKPLKLSVQMPAAREGEEETQPLHIEVKVSSDENADYTIESSKLALSFTATEVLLGEGDEAQSLPDFKPLTVEMDLDQYKINLSSR